MLVLLSLLLSTVLADLYSRNDDVITLNSQNFDEYVNSESPILVEFYANWCGHCKNLAPELKKAASSLKGIARIGVVESDQNDVLMQKYGIRGFPTLLYFANGKQSEFPGSRTAGAIVDDYLRFLTQTAKSRLNGNSGSKNNEKKSEDGTVVELTESSFDEFVLSGTDFWFVEFYAPWCKHCQNLAPTWRNVASRLSGKVKVGAVDSTKNERLSARFEIRGYPTLKFFSPGSPAGITYEGARGLDDMVSWAEQQVEMGGASAQLIELTSQTTWDEICGVRSLCIIAFVPHLLDCNAACRMGYQEMLQKVADSSRSTLYGWMWTEGGVQRELESSLEIGGFGYPAMVIISRTRMRYSIFKGTFDREGINDFLGLVLGGKVSTSSIESFPNIVTTEPWDGKDAQVTVEEEYDLSDVFNDDL